MPKYDVITVGSATVDAFVHTDRSELIKIMDSRHEEALLAYPSGSKLLVTRLEFTTGGGGTNTAVSLSRLGLKTAHLGRIGNDENADRIISLLNKEKVDFIGKRGKIMSGFSIILDSIEHDRTILAYKGANDNFDFRDIKKGALKTRWFYFSSMMGKSFEAMKKLAVFAKKNKINIVFNPSSYLAEKGIKYLKPVLDAAKILVLNDEEAACLVGNREKAESIEQLLRKLNTHVPIVVITAGKKGAHCSDKKNIYFAKANKIRVVESTGAGDAFASSFLAGYMKKNDIMFALKLAVTNAESVIQHHGAKNKLLKYSQALAVMKKRKVKVIKKRF